MLSTDFLDQIPSLIPSNISPALILSEAGEGDLRGELQGGTAETAVNPSYPLKPKLKAVRPNYRPTESELARVFASLYPGARRFFLAFCNSGCRLSELRNCNVKDADLDNRALRVIGKGRKERLIPMNQDLLGCIWEELAQRPGAHSDDPLFVNREGKRYRSLRTALSRACEIADVPHCFTIRSAMPMLRCSISGVPTWFFCPASWYTPIQP